MTSRTRKTAQERFAQIERKQNVVASERKAAETELAAKTARLRALRLAKEAAESNEESTRERPRQARGSGSKKTA